MQVNRMFNWEPGNIRSDAAPAPEKKKGWLSKISDSFGLSVEPPELYDRKGMARMYGDMGKASCGDVAALRYETVALIMEKALVPRQSDLFRMGMEIASGAMTGPIGFTIQGVKTHPALEGIAFREPADRERAMISSVLLMGSPQDDPAGSAPADAAKALRKRAAFTDAAQELLKRAAEDSTSPGRAAAATSVLEALAAPGASMDEKSSISRDALWIMRGDVSPTWVYSRSLEYGTAGTPGAARFASFLEGSLESLLGPFNAGLAGAAEGRSGTDRERAVLTEAARAAGSEPEGRLIASLAALKMLADGEGADASRAKAALELLTDTESRKGASILADMVLSGGASLPPSLPSLIAAGGALSKAEDTGSGWIEPLLAYMGSATGGDGLKELSETALTLAGSLPARTKKQFAGAFFDSLPSDGKIPAPLLFARTGAKMVAGMDSSSSDGRKTIAASAKVFLDAAASGTGKTGEAARLSAALVDSLQGQAASTFGVHALEEVADGVTSVEKSLAAAALKAAESLPEEYSDQRKAKTNAVRTALEKIRDGAADAGVKILVSGALRSLDADKCTVAFRNGTAVMKALRAGMPADPPAAFAGMLRTTLDELPEEYSDQRSAKTATAAVFLEALGEVAQEPALSARVARALDVLNAVEEKVANAKGELFTVSNCNGFEVALGVMQSIAGGGSPGPAEEIAGAGAAFVAAMPVEYSDQRERQSIIARRFFSMVEKHETDPSKVRTAAAYRELLEGLGKDAGQSIGLDGLKHLAKSGGPVLASLAPAAKRHFDGLPVEYSDQRKRKMGAAAAIFETLEKYAESPSGKTLATAMTLFWKNRISDKGFEAADATFRVLAEVESSPGGAESSMALVERVKALCPAEVSRDIEKFFNDSAGSIYLMKEAVERPGAAQAQVVQQDEFVVINGVKLKKGKSRSQS